ncbi:stalk domain-containing protein [Brevibacillus panacihumi]|uniref:stalk domain-containing protein n=1 Tax=Brevibacillus panacihumi TaxID=497735 RepID=UPI003CFD56F6
MKSIHKTSLLVCLTIFTMFSSIGVVLYWPSLVAFFTSEQTATPQDAGVDPFSYDPPLPSYVKNLHPHYTIEAELHPSDAKITGKMSIEFDNPRSDSLILYVYDYLWNKMSVKAVRYQEKSLPFERGLSQIKLSNPLGEVERGKIEVEFEHPVPRRGTRYGVKDDIWTLTTWYPMLGAQNQQGEWYDPPLRINYGDPFIYHYADYDVSFISPKGYQWVSSWGRGTAEDLGNNRQKVRYQGQKLLNFALVGSPLYQIETITLESGLQVDIASVDKGNIERIKSIAESVFPTYTEWFGPLPYPHAAIAETSTGTTYAMEYANMAIFKRDMHQRNLIDHWLPHEVAHMWWYNSVATLESVHGWVDEGLVEISVSYYLQGRYGAQSSSSLLEEYERDLQKLRVKYPHGRLSKSLQQFATEEEFHWTWYSKGALLFENLRRQIGDEAYKNFLKRVQQNYHGSVIGAEHLDQALGQALQGEASYFVPNIQQTNDKPFLPARLEPYITTVLNGMSYYPPIPARLKDDTVYVPLRDVGEQLGVKIEWNEKDKRIHLQANGRVVQIPEKQQIAEVDGKPLDLGVPLLEIKKRAMVPLSLFEDALGFDVYYDAEQKTVKIAKPSPISKAKTL